MYIFWFYKKIKRTNGLAQVVEYLPSKLKALSSKPLYCPKNKIKSIYTHRGKKEKYAKM
jgi:hypothetical protein